MLNRLFTLRSAWAGYNSAITVSARRAMQKQRWLLLGASLLMLASQPGRADDDHERARQALENRQILPLRTILERVEKTYPGQVIDVEFEQEREQNKDRGLWIYEIKLLRSGGSLIKLKVDARDGTIIGVRPKETRKPGKEER